MKIILKQDLRTPAGKLKAGDEVVIACDKNGVPLDKFWRNRVNDSIIDNALEIVNEDKINNEIEIVKTKNKK